jgi:hypothetical protein
MNTPTSLRWIQRALLAYACLSLSVSWAENSPVAIPELPVDQPAFAEATIAQKAALREISTYMAVPGADQTEIYLREMGFKLVAPPTAEAWREFPSVRKIETAVLRAEYAKPGSGRDFLATLSRKLSAKYPAVVNEVACQRLLRDLSTPVEKFIFSRGPPPSEIVLSKEYRAIIGEISDFCHGSPINSPRLALIRNYKLSEDLAYEILRNAPSSESALVQGLSYVPADERAKALGSLAKDLASENHVFAARPGISMLLREPPRIPGDPVFSPSDRPGSFGERDFNISEVERHGGAPFTAQRSAAGRSAAASTSKNAGGDAASEAFDLAGGTGEIGTSSTIRPFGLGPQSGLSPEEIQRLLESTHHSPYVPGEGYSNLHPDPFHPESAPPWVDDAAHLRGVSSGAAEVAAGRGAVILGEDTLRVAEHAAPVAKIGKGLIAGIVAIFVGLGKLLFGGRRDNGS